MRNRGLLAFSDIDAFARWMDENKGWKREKTPESALYEVLRLRHPDEKIPIILYARGGAAMHVTVHGKRLTRLVREFIRWKRGEKDVRPNL